MEPAKNIEVLLKDIPKDVRIVAATKYACAQDMKKLLVFGIKDFGENRGDVFLQKYAELKDEKILWHFIGHLQNNKAKEIIPKINFLHSLDSLKLAEQIEVLRKTPLDCFVEVNINEEPQKNGILIKELPSFLNGLKKFPKVHVVGFMMMSTKEGTAEDKFAQFLSLKRIKDSIDASLELSMGMSDDYKEALKAGATTLRLGRILWEMN